MSTASSIAKPISLRLVERDAVTVAAMAAALAMPVDAFVGGIVAAWLEKPRNFRRFAKRRLADAEGKAGDARRSRVRKLSRELKRARRAEEAAAKKVERKSTKASTKAKPRKKATAATSAKAKRGRADNAIVVVHASPAKPPAAAPTLVASV